MILLLNENFQLTDQLPVPIVLVKRVSTIPLVIKKCITLTETRSCYHTALLPFPFDYIVDIIPSQ